MPLQSNLIAGFGTLLGFQFAGEMLGAKRGRRSRPRSAPRRSPGDRVRSRIASVVAPASASGMEPVVDRPFNQMFVGSMAPFRAKAGRP